MSTQWHASIVYQAKTLKRLSPLSLSTHKLWRSGHDLGLNTDFLCVLEMDMGPLRSLFYTVTRNIAPMMHQWMYQVTIRSVHSRTEHEGRLDWHFTPFVSSKINYYYLFVLHITLHSPSCYGGKGMLVQRWKWICECPASKLYWLLYTGIIQ